MAVEAVTVGLLDAALKWVDVGDHVVLGFLLCGG